MNKNRSWIGFKDIILIALLTALSVVIQLVAAMPFMASPKMMMFASVAIIMIVCGPVYMLMLSKAPRKGAAFLFLGIQALYYVLLGQITIALSFFLCAIVSECVMIGGYHKPLRIGIAYVVFAVFYPLCNYLPYLILADQYEAQFVAAGMPQAAIDSMMGYFASPVMILLAAICAFVCGALGAFIGYKMLKKHFKPAGVV